MKRIFKDWIFDGYTLSNDKYCLWVCNGFCFFADHRMFNNAKPLLSLMGFLEKLKLWREVKKEKKLRGKELFTNL